MPQIKITKDNKTSYYKRTAIEFKGDPAQTTSFHHATNYVSEKYANTIANNLSKRFEGLVFEVE
jgi:hypothetical protein